MKLLEDIRGYQKEWVFDCYSRIIENFKDYEKISKVKMVEAVYQLYNSDYCSIIDICTEKELRLLKRIIEGEQISYWDKKIEWEKDLLHDKFLICLGDENFYVIPEEILESVEKAIRTLHWTDVRKMDKVHEIAVGIMKAYGEMDFLCFVKVLKVFTTLKDNDITTYLCENRLFHFFVYFDTTQLEDELPSLVYQEYYDVVDDLRERKKDNVFPQFIDLENYISLFYNEFNVCNETVKKFYKELLELPFFSFSAIPIIRKYALLNLERESLKQSIADVGSLKNTDLRPFFKLMDEAMNEMPSGVLNGLTPNHYEELQNKEAEMKFQNQNNYVKQKNACLSSKDADLFYKLYFGLLSYTNDLYVIEPKIRKLDRKKGVNPVEIASIVDRFWKEKDQIIAKFILENPNHYTKSQLEIIDEFRFGMQDHFVIANFEKEYTAFIDKNEKIYMVKGLNSNIDEILSVDDIPMFVQTALLPFKGSIISDGMYRSIPVSLDLNFHRLINENYKRGIKYYHF